MKEINWIKFLEIEKLNSLNEIDLKKELVSSEKKYFSIRIKKQLGEIKQTHTIKFLRRYIARIRTIANIKGINLD